MLSQTNPLLANIVTLELAGEIEMWSFIGDAVQVMLRTERRCRCREMHYWFVNRDGVTRCVACDEKYTRDAAATRKAGSA
jgi:hypothetical protein